MEKKYRQNVGIILLKKDAKGKFLIFAGQRISQPENDKYSWQMPQGGVDEGEDILAAAYREMYEEIGVKKENVMLVSKMPHTIKYNFPPEVMEEHAKKQDYLSQFCGQEQHWFVFQYFGKDEEINLHATDEPQEFRTWKWETTKFLIKHIVPFKKETYKRVFEWLEGVM